MIGTLKSIVYMVNGREEKFVKFKDAPAVVPRDGQFVKVTNATGEVIKGFVGAADWFYDDIEHDTRPSVVVHLQEPL